MCANPSEELSLISKKELIRRFKRAIELNVTNTGNGQSPYEIEELEAEISRRIPESD